MRRAFRRIAGILAVAGAGSGTAGCHSLERRDTRLGIAPAGSTGGRWTSADDAGVGGATPAVAPAALPGVEPVLEPISGGERPIGFAESLGIAAADNPTIALAFEVLREAQILERGTGLAWLPDLQAGASFRQHAGPLQQGNGSILDLDSRSLDFGAGAGASGTGPVLYPGVRIYYPLGEFLLEPRAARERTAARAADADAVRNRVLTSVAEAYVEARRANAEREALRAGRILLADLVRITEAFARAGQGRQADADRARANAELLDRQYEAAAGEAAAAAARLSGLLNLDPTRRLQPVVTPLAPARRIDENGPLQELERRAVASRPEIAARAAELAEAMTRLRQERMRPLLPTISAGFSAGGFGGGGNLVPYSFSKFDARTDFDVVATWTLQNAGIGNRALKLRAASSVAQARARATSTIDEVRGQVAVAQAEAQASAVRLELTRGRLAIAEEGYRQEARRTGEGLGRAIESLDSFRQLLDSRREVVNATAAYEVAQLRLLASVEGMAGVGD